jgi:hypothetical protein
MMITKCLLRKDVLAHFGDAVARNEYKKIEYKIYRTLVGGCDSNTIIVTYEPIREEIIINYIPIHKSDYENIVLNKNDSSFGQYLFDHFFAKAENETAQMSNCTATLVDKNIAFSTNYTIISPNDNPYYNTAPYMTTIDNNIIKEREDKKMDTNKMFNFEFGPVSSECYRLSPYGIAVNTSRNGWVSYNVKTQEVFNVDVINFDASKVIYKMPVALNAIAAGDILMHCGKPVFVREVHLNRGIVSAVDFTTSTLVDILPVKSPFGFNFFTKVCSLIDFTNAASANADNPFGNLLPFMLMGDNQNGDFDPALAFFMMNNGNMDFKNNPMAWYFLMNRSDNKNSDILPFLFMNMTPQTITSPSAN